MATTGAKVMANAVVLNNFSMRIIFSSSMLK